MITRNLRAALLAPLGLLAPATAHALTFELPAFGEESIGAVLNTSVTIGAGIRMQDRAVDLVGKANLDPQVCTGPNGAYQSCQGLFKNQIHPAQRLVAAPGAASINNDDGNLNYNRGDLFSGLAKVTSDLTLSYGDFGFFGRLLYYHDAVNARYREYHPNRITDDNYLSVGRETPAAPLPPLDLPALLNDPAALFTGVVVSRPWGQPGANGGRISYGPGGVVQNSRSDGEVLREVGTDLQLLDAVVYGKLPL